MAIKKSVKPTPPVSAQIFRAHFKPVFDDSFADLLAKLDKIDEK